MNGPIAPCGHPGEAIFGNFVLCRICDAPKAEPAAPALPVGCLMIVLYEGVMPARPEDSSHRSRALLRAGAASNGQGAFTAQAKALLNGRAVYFRVEGATGVVAIQGTVTQQGDGGDMVMDNTFLSAGQDVTLRLTLDPVLSTVIAPPTPVAYGPFQLLSTGSLPGGLSANTDYWSDSVPMLLSRLSTSPADAAAGIFVTLTSYGSGLLTTISNLAPP